MEKFGDVIGNGFPYFLKTIENNEMADQKFH